MAGRIKGKQLEDNTITGTQIDTDSGSQSTINAGDAAVPGTAAGVALKDHQHEVATGGATVPVQIDGVAGEGVSSNLAREDHTHELESNTPPTNTDKSAAVTGTSTQPARADHKHDVATDTAVAITDATNAEGTSTSLARADHQHAHGNLSGGLLHSQATIITAGFMSPADKAKLDSLVSPDLVDAKESVCILETSASVTTSGAQTVQGVVLADGDRVALFGQTPAIDNGIYIVNTMALWVRADDFTTGSDQASAVIPVEKGANADQIWKISNDSGAATVGTDALVPIWTGSGSPRTAGQGLVLNGNDFDVVSADGSIIVNADDISVGVLQTDAQHGNLGGGALHALVTPTVDGFMSAVDKTKLDTIDADAEENYIRHEEIITAENVSGVDVNLTDQLNFVPVSADYVSFFVNGVKQTKGQSYNIAGQVITWLGSVAGVHILETDDCLEVVYYSAAP